MTSRILIRDFSPGEEAALRELFHDSVHTLAASHYTQAQRDAWAPPEHDAAAWAARLQHNQPFVAEVNGQRAGFADVQPTGYIDHFFVSPLFPRQGVGTALMRRIHEAAAAQRFPRLYSDVSLSAQPLFLRHGFVVVQRQQVQRLGVTLENARMEKSLG
jgi:putative acetyltransferase